MHLNPSRLSSCQNQICNLAEYLPKRADFLRQKSHMQERQTLMMRLVIPDETSQLGQVYIHLQNKERFSDDVTLFLMVLGFLMSSLLDSFLLKKERPQKSGWQQMQNKQKIACELQKKREIVDKVNLEMSIDGQQIAKPSVFAIFLALYAFLSIHENQFSAPKRSSEHARITLFTSFLVNINGNFLHSIIIHFSKFL